jgi:predicted RNA binding protein YcfA (HicA-like mRNA interferase family)
MPDFSSDEIIKKLLKAGFLLDRIKGSHHIYKHPNGKRAIVPHPRKDLPKGTYYSILKQAGLD